MTKNYTVLALPTLWERRWPSEFENLLVMMHSERNKKKTFLQDQWGKSKPLKFCHLPLESQHTWRGSRRSGIATLCPWQGWDFTSVIWPRPNASIEVTETRIGTSWNLCILDDLKTSDQNDQKMWFLEDQNWLPTNRSSTNLQHLFFIQRN